MSGAAGMESVAGACVYSAKANATKIAFWELCFSIAWRWDR